MIGALAELIRVGAGASRRRGLSLRQRRFQLLLSLLVLLLWLLVDSRFGGDIDIS